MRKILWSIAGLGSKILLLLFLCFQAHAESIMEKYGLIKKGACVESTDLEYVIVQKIDDHHYELRYPYGDDPYAYLETKQAIYDNIGRPIGIGMLYVGDKEMKLANGFTKNFHLWRECRFNKYAATMAGGCLECALPRQQEEQAIVKKRKRRHKVK